MSEKTFQQDRRLDILILGPMNGKNETESSSAIIGKAVENILAEVLSQNLLKASLIKQHYIHLPEHWEEPEIVRGVLSHIDIADLVIINLTPKEGIHGAPSPNVYYELALLHALGLPTIVLSQEGTALPFYLKTTRNTRVAEFSIEEVANKLRTPIQRFLDLQDTTDFTDNRVTQFYDGLPIVDISAAVGLATGYYHNFVGRMLRDGSFVSIYPDKVKQLIVVRPFDVLDTYEMDKERLIAALDKEGYVLKEDEKLPPPPSDKKGLVWINHVDGIVIDLPRTIYPLKISPRLLSMQDRLDKSGEKDTSQHQRNLILKRTSESLLNRVERAIKYHVNKEREGYRKNLLHFKAIHEVPTFLKELGVKPNKV